MFKECVFFFLKKKEVAGTALKVRRYIDFHVSRLVVLI